MSKKKSKKVIVGKINDQFRISYGDVDLSSKNKISIIPQKQEYEEQTMLQLQNYSRQIAEVKKQYYSSNAAIDRILARSFSDILKAVWKSELQKTRHKKKVVKQIDDHSVDVKAK